MKAIRGRGTVVGARRPFFSWTFRWAGPRLRRSILAMLGGALLVPAGLTSLAQAQQPQSRPASTSLPPKSYMNKTSAILPIQIDPRLRATLREVQLYVKDDPSRPWMLKDSAPPEQKEFTFRAARDGEYWFTVVTVDKAGRFSPPDVRNVSPGVIVVVDTQAPEPDLRCLPETPDGHCVQCNVRDANPDPTKTRFEYQTGDQKWRPLDPLPNQADVFCIPAQAVTTGKVRVTTADRCNNSATREIDLATCGGVATTAANESDKGPALNNASASRPVSEPAPGAQRQDNTPNNVARSTPQTMAPQVQQQALPVGAVDSQATTTTPANSQVTQVGYFAGANGSGPGSQGATSSVSSAPAVRKVVNNPRIYLDYKIDQSGPSGVGKVEIYVTRNQGQSWDRYGEDEDRQSPVVVELPGEGIYGIKLMVSNGRGFGGGPPSSGDAPDWCVEVDTVKPFVELTSVQSGQGTEAGVVSINYTTRDKNLAADPIELYYAPNLEGPWQPIARGLKNDSQYHWSVPREAGGQAFIRLKVTDMAGNSAQCETTQPVLLDDGYRPHVHVTGVSTNGPTNSSASATNLPTFPQQ